MYTQFKISTNRTLQSYPHHHHHEDMLIACIPLAFSWHPSLCIWNFLFTTLTTHTELIKVFAGQQKCVCMSESIREHHLWIHPYIFISAQHVLFAYLGLLVRWKVSGHTAAILWGAPSRICSKEHAVSLGSSHEAFSYGISLESKVQPYNSTDIATAWKNLFCCIVARKRYTVK